VTFSNLAGEGRDATDAYVASLLALLGDQQPLPVLASTPGRLDEVLRGAAPEALVRPEAPRKWSVAGVLQHLADSEVVNGYRIRLMLGADTPAIQAYDQDAWASALRYDRADAHLALRDFSAARAANLRIWETLDPASLGRCGMHAERGQESVGRLIALLAAHDLVHRRQISRILGASPD